MKFSINFMTGKSIRCEKCARCLRGISECGTSINPDSEICNSIFEEIDTIGEFKKTAKALKNILK